MNRRLVAALVFFAMAGPTVPAPAWARPPTLTRAEQLKKKGDEALDEGHPDQALSLYRDAYELSRDATLLYNEARALESLARYADSLASLEQFEREATPAVKARVPGLSELVLTVRQKVTVLTLTSDVAGAEVRVGGNVVGTTPLQPLRVNAGTTVVEARRDGFVPFHTELALPGGGNAEVRLVLAPVALGGRLAVTSLAGTRVRVDGSEQGSTPLELALSVGTHHVQMSREGYVPRETYVTLANGERRELDLALEKEPAFYTRWWFWTGVGVVVVAGATVAYVATQDGAKKEGSIAPGNLTTGLIRF